MSGKSIFLWNCVRNQNFSEICFEKSKLFVKLPEKNRNFFGNLPWKMDFSLPEKNRNFLWNCLKNRNFSKICPEKSIFFVWNCLKIEILRKFPLKNRYFLWNYLNKIEIFRKFEKSIFFFVKLPEKSKFFDPVPRLPRFQTGLTPLRLI